MMNIDVLKMKITEAEEMLDAADMYCNAIDYEYIEAKEKRAEAWQTLHNLKTELERAETIIANHRNLIALMRRPLSPEAKTDALKLKELEERFPGAVFSLITGISHYDIKSDGSAIYCVNPNIVCSSFDQFDMSEWRELRMEFRGMYADLSQHL